MISNKQDFGVADLVSTHNTDSQAYDFRVMRKQYAQGDCFLIAAMYGYQGDILSGRGDEQDPSPFAGTVEAIDWERGALVFRPGAYGCAKLATSRPIINLNAEKWLTAGKAVIEPVAGEYPMLPRDFALTA